MSAPKPPSAPPPKIMSSRLLTMKFMQRGAASASPTTPSIPRYPSKRQRLSNGRSSPATTTSPADARAVQAALAAEEAKRQAALDRQAYEAGETKWVLSVKETTEGRMDGGFRVTRMGEGDTVLREAGGVEVEEGEAAPWGDGGLGRRSFGMFNKALEKRQNRDGRSSSEESRFSASDSSGDSDEENSSDEDDRSGVGALTREEQSEAAQLARAERKAKRRSTDAEAARPAGKRRKEMKEVQLSQLSSISGTGGLQRPEYQQKEKKTIARMSRIRDRNMQY